MNWKIKLNMLRIHQVGSLKAWITIIQILGIYGKYQPKTNLKDVAQNNELFAVYSLPKTIECFRRSVERNSRNRKSSNQRHSVYFLWGWCSNVRN